MSFSIKNVSCIVTDNLARLIGWIRIFPACSDAGYISVWQNALDDGLYLIAKFEDDVPLSRNDEHKLNAADVAVQDRSNLDIVFLSNHR